MNADEAHGIELSSVGISSLVGVVWCLPPEFGGAISSFRLAPGASGPALSRAGFEAWVRREGVLRKFAIRLNLNYPFVGYLVGETS